MNHSELGEPLDRREQGEDLHKAQTAHEDADVAQSLFHLMHGLLGGRSHQGKWHLLDLLAIQRLPLYPFQYHGSMLRLPSALCRINDNH